MGKKGGGNEAAQARQDEQTRQANIRSGTDNVNSIFDGGTSRQLVKPTGGAMDFSTGDYYDASGNKLTNKVTKFDNEKVYGPSSTVAGQFTPDFYEKQKQGYLDYANPQVDKQFNDASKQLTFALARGNNLDSSAAATQSGDLQTQYGLQKQKVADDALSYENKAKSSVEDARSNLISNLNATGDAQGAVNSATARASALSQPAAYSPLTNLFSDFTAGLGTQAALEKANYYSGGATGARYQTGLFAPSVSAVKVS
jgi:hypothetical protein